MPDSSPILSRLILSRSDSARRYGPLILMYHATVPGNKKQKFIYSIDSPRFWRHLDLLEKMGWHTACIRDLNKKDELPAKTVIITFDDGFANNYEGAFLPLLKRGMKATWFITSGCINSYSTWLDCHLNDRMLSSDQLREMHRQGMEIGSHTISHPDLTTLTEEELEHEIGQSKQQLEEIVNAPVVSFAYPYGRYHHKAVESVRKNGYSFACSVRPGWYSCRANDYELPRITIFSGDSPGIFARKLVFGSNDVSWNQIIRYYQKRLVARV